MFDGYGRCHQRQAGMATAVAVERDLVAVGVAKEYHTGLSGGESGCLIPWPTPGREADEGRADKRRAVISPRQDDARRRPGPLPERAGDVQTEGTGALAA